MLVNGTKALFLLALLTASSLGLIIPVMIKVALILGELSKRAIEENITERIIDRTADYVKDVASILNEWLSINTTSIGEHNTTSININKSSPNNLMETTNKTIEDSIANDYANNKYASTTVTIEDSILNNYVRCYQRMMEYIRKPLTPRFNPQ